MLKQSYTHALLSLLLSMTMIAVQGAQLKFKDTSVVGRGKLGEVGLYHSDEGGYSALRNGKREPISTVNIVAELLVLKKDVFFRKSSRKV